MELTVKVLTGLLLFGVVTAYSGNDQITAVTDLIHYLRYPVQVIVATCWNGKKKLEFWNELNNSTRSPAIAVHFVDEDPQNLPWSDPRQHQSLIVVDASCPRSRSLLQKSGQLLYYRVKWVIINSDRPNCEDFSELFKDLQVLISSEIFYFCKSNRPQEYAIKQVYRYALRTDLVEETFGYWSHGAIIRLLQPTVSSVRRQNLNHFKLRASLVITHNETLNHLDDYADKHVDTITKENYFFTLYVAQHLNATLQFSHVNSWGYRDKKTGRFNGMIGELQTDRADLGGTALFFTSERIREIDYLSMTTPTRAKFIFRSPKLSITDNVFLLPFTGPVWLCIISFIALAGILLLIIMQVEIRYTIARYTGGIRPTLVDTLLNMFGTSCQQGSYLEPKSVPAKCLILLSLVVLMFLYASYSANIVALIQSPSSKIQTVEDLLNSRLQMGAEDTVYNRYYISHQTEPVRKAIYERKIKHGNRGEPNFISLEQGVKKIRQGLFAFHVELGVCYKLISETFQEDEKCGLQEIVYINLIDPYYAVQKNSSFRELVRISLFKLREFGIQDREHALLYTKKPRCTGGSSSFIAVSIVDVWPALMLLGWGFGIACGLMVIEKGWDRARRRQKQNRVGVVQGEEFFKRTVY